MAIGRPLSRRGALALTASAAVCPAAWAQDAGRTYRLGFLVQPERRQFDPIFDELRRAGFIEGRNLSVDSRGFGIPVERLEASAAELVQAQPDAIYSGGAVANQIIKRATTTIPVVVTSDDIIRDGIVTSLSHPDAKTSPASASSPPSSTRSAWVFWSAWHPISAMSVYWWIRARRPTII